MLNKTLNLSVPPVQQKLLVHLIYTSTPDIFPITIYSYGSRGSTYYYVENMYSGSIDFTIPGPGVPFDATLIIDVRGGYHALSGSPSPKYFQAVSGLNALVPIAPGETTLSLHAYGE